MPPVQSRMDSHHRDALRAEFIKRNDGMFDSGHGCRQDHAFRDAFFVDSGKIIIIISPLNALEEDQASRFRKMGLSAVAVNGDTYSDKIHKGAYY
ncbi:hypothetical protein DFH09DRAFT_1308318 [Mycena vulgaris]|nr:hypothetical protein DFH09DRAFT_1308318 [Mycena vulgaris]